MRPVGTMMLVEPHKVAQVAKVCRPDGSPVDIQLLIPHDLSVAHDRVSRVVSLGTKCMGVARSGDLVLHSPFATVELEWLGHHRLLDEEEIDLVFQEVTDHE